MDPFDYLIATIKSKFDQNQGVAFTEPALHKEFNKLEGEGALAALLAEQGKTLDEALSAFPEQFSKSGGQWRYKSDGSTAAITQLMSEAKRKAGKSKGASGGGGRGGFGGGRGGGRTNFIPRNMPNHHAGFKHNGYTPHNRGQHHRPQQFQPHQQQPQRPASQFSSSTSFTSRNNYPSMMISNQQPVGYRSDRDSFRAPSPSSRRNEDIDSRDYNASRPYFAQSAYDEPRRTPSPPRSSYNSGHAQSYRPNNNRSPDRQRYRSPDRRAPSPPRPQRRPSPPPGLPYRPSPPPGLGPQRNRSPDRRASPPRYQRRLSPPPGLEPPRNRSPDRRSVHHQEPSNYERPVRRVVPQNEPPSRQQQPRSRASSRDSLFSQISSHSDAPSAAPSAPPGINISQAKQRSKARAEVVDQSTVQDLARQFAANVEVRPPPKTVVEVNDATSRLARKCKKAMGRFSGTTHVTSLIAAFEKELKAVCPGHNYQGKVDYINGLKYAFPDVLGPLEINHNETLASWTESTTSSSVASSSKATSVTSVNVVEEPRDPALEDKVRQYVDSIDSKTVDIKREAEKLSKRLDRSYSIVVSSLTYVLFQYYKGKYRYQRDSTDIAVMCEERNDETTPDFYRAQHVHWLFDRPSTGAKMEVEVTRFLKFEKFSVRLINDLEAFEQMDREIQSICSDPRSRRRFPSDAWRVGHACVVLMKDADSLPKWNRGVVTGHDNGMAKVFAMDIGQMLLADYEKLRPMPSKYLTWSPYALHCSLDAEKDELADMNGEIRTWKKCFEESSVNCWIRKSRNENEDVKTMDSIMKVDLLVKTQGSRDLKNILDV